MTVHCIMIMSDYNINWMDTKVMVDYFIGNKSYNRPTNKRIHLQRLQNRGTQSNKD